MKLRSKLFYAYLLCLVIYGGFTLLPRPDPVTLQRYDVSELGLRLIYLTILVLVAGIWYAGFYGYAKLRNYSRLIADSKDGKQVAKITKGVFLLVLWLPASFVSSAILNFLAARHSGLQTATVIINHYISLLFPLAGFIFISLGTRGLSELVRQRPSYRATNIMAVVLVYIGLIDYHLIASTPGRAQIYHMSIWLITTTLVAPYICMWFTGMLATYEIYLYRLKVKGIVYRQSWNLLTLGLGWLILVSISFQYLTTVTTRLTDLSIYWLLAIIYSLLLVLSVGFVLVALGARKLQKIEEV
ncbi:MAG: hypothetical protein JWN38_22 [Candidatus Saccharibacteria bacterium]|nr:hypothetical protein [Candidatus Saccharibacteria bacterium]